MLKHLLMLTAVLVLAIAPAAVRMSEHRAKWALVRVGARPVDEDPNHGTVHVVKQLLDSADSIDPTLLLLGVLGLVGLFLSLLAPSGRGYSGPTDGCITSLAEWGLCAGWSSRAPPRA